MTISSEDELRKLFGFPADRAKIKQLNALEHHSIKFINNSPFLTLSTGSAIGKLDCSPRGGEPGFVQVLDQNTLVIPEARGNNRLDILVNIVETQQVGCLFLIPGMDETLRVNGTASISNDSDLLSRFESERRPPKACIVISVKEVFLHCAKALMRAQLWSADAQIDRASFPSTGQMMKDQLNLTEPAETQEAMLERYKESL